MKEVTCYLNLAQLAEMVPWLNECVGKGSWYWTRSNYKDEYNSEYHTTRRGNVTIVFERDEDATLFSLRWPKNG